MHAHMIVDYDLAPPIVCPMGGLTEIITNMGGETTLSFTILLIFISTTLHFL